MAYQNTKNKKHRQEEQTVLAVIVMGIFKALWWLIKLPFTRGKKARITQSDIDYIRSKRREIEGLLNSENTIELKHAVLEADKLVDFTLRSYGYGGQTFADRLRSAERYIDRNLYNMIWFGHKTRNRIAHEDDLQLSHDQLREAATRLLIYVRGI